jgi:hypothetical protein
MCSLTMQIHLIFSISMKKIVFFCICVIMFSCTISISEFRRVMVVSIRNDSGMGIERVLLRFRTEDGVFIEEPIVLTKLPNGQKSEIRYNLEHISGFQEISAVIRVEFSNSSKILDGHINTFDNRRVYSNAYVFIKNDVLIIDASNKR